MTWNGSALTPVTAPVGPPNQPVLNGVSCLGLSGCVAAGSYTPELEPSKTLIESDLSTAPVCQLTATIPGPPAQIQVTVQDVTSGLASIVATAHQNATVSIPPFTVGTTDPVVVTATKIDQSKGSTLRLKVTDVAGQTTLCA